MSSPKLELVKRQNPPLASLFEELTAYILHQVEGGQNFILPKLAGAALKINDGEAYVLLELLANAGMVKRAFNVYCGLNNVLLATVDSPDKLDDVPYCDFCDCQHKSDELILEIAFVPSAIGNDRQRAA